ncbi:MAG TPA: hypothetical protein PK402_04810 [Tepidisphaeraceae bacterium]|nr:hypothetical protein [Tepidisphaeraceae bacterium]
MRNWIITTKQHALVDYIWSTALPAIPRMLGWNRKTTTILDSVAAIGAAQTTLTDFEGGVRGVIPMQCHLANDLLMGLGLLAVAASLNEEPSEERIGLAAAGLFAVGTALITEPIPRGRGRQRAKSAAKVWRDAMGETVGHVAGANPKRSRSRHGTDAHAEETTAAQ